MLQSVFFYWDPGASGLLKANAAQKAGEKESGNTKDSDEGFFFFFFSGCCKDIGLRWCTSRESIRNRKLVSASGANAMFLFGIQNNDYLSNVE